VLVNVFVSGLTRATLTGPGKDPNHLAIDFVVIFVRKNWLTRFQRTVAASTNRALLSNITVAVFTDCHGVGPSC
jgi:hypothetical protein